MIGEYVCWGLVIVGVIGGVLLVYALCWVGGGADGHLGE